MTAKLVLDVQLRKLHPDAIVPKYQTAGAAGFDLHARLDKAIYIEPRSSAKVSTGIAVSINDPQWGLFLFPRSSLGSRGIRLANCVGVIDSDYQGELLAVIRNESVSTTFTVNNGDRICQGVFMPVLQARFIEVAEFDVTTQRGTGGFGSTGK